jgi:hypothetical protein
MALPGLFPIYPDPIPLKYQVSLAIPMPGNGSEISKSLGITASYPLLIPNVDMLQAFIKGDIGISDKLTKESLFLNFNNPIAQKDPKVLKSFAKNANFDLPDVEKYKKEDGKIKIPKEDVVVPPMDGIGLKGFEKTLLTSIFETQKPYLEVAKLVIGNIAKIEDIIARVMPLLGIPLVTKSLKPIGNNGVPGGRPKAMGYKNGEELKATLAKLQALAKKGTNVKIDKNGNATREMNPFDKSGATASISGPGPNNTDSGSGSSDNWKIISTVYSTGAFDPKIDYQYIYIDLPPENKEPEEESDLNLENDDPFDKFKPKNIILGIFRKDGTPLNPNQPLKSINVDGNGNIIQENSIYKSADWILQSPKWRFTGGAYQWPAFGLPTYTWERYLGAEKQNSKTQPSNSNPAPAWQLKKYKEGDKNILNGEDAIVGDPVIAGFDTPEINEYRSFFTDLVKFKMSQADLEQADKNTYSKEILDKLNIPSHLENVFLYGQAKSSVYKEINGKPAYPDSMKISFKPFQIYSAAAEADPKLKAYSIENNKTPGMIWIDPESDYETKIIRVDPTTSIGYKEAQGESDVKSSIKSFVKNKATFNISNGILFDVEISKNGENSEFVYNTSSYVLENWNYYKANILSTDNPIIQNQNSYSIKISSKTANSYYINKSSEEFATGNKFAEIVFNGSNWSYVEFNKTAITDANGYVTGYNRNYIDVSDGIKILGDGSKAYVANGFITKWIYLEETYDKTTLPPFGKDRTFSINYVGVGTSGYSPVTVSDVNISLYKINVTSSEFPYGKVIDPSNVTNEPLKKAELFSTGKYGHGDINNPQEIDVIKRYMLTDLDTESYYIIEGVLTEKNTQTGDNTANAANSGSGGGNAGGGFYKLPHAIGAIKVFISMLVDVFSKLIPAIVKLLKLFKNPASFVTDIIAEKMGESFSIFSKESVKYFESAKSTKEKVKGKKPSERSREVSQVFKESSLKNHVFVDKKGDFKFLLDGVAMLPFELFGAKIPFGMELNFDKIPDSSPIKLIMSDGLSKAKSKNLQAFLKPSLKDFKGPGADGKTGQLNLSDLKNLEDPIYKKFPNDLKTNPNDSIVTDIKYSTGTFINGVDYNYIYINEDTDRLLKEADELINTNPDLIGATQSAETLDKLKDALKNDQKNEAIKDRIKKLKAKGFDDSSQPLLKMLMGFVTLPIKIVAGIIEYIMDFFKSLANPLTLVPKMIEFLSFSWIMKFFTPIGILNLAGVVFEPKKIAEWVALVNVPNPVPPAKPEIPDGYNLPSDITYKDAVPKGKFLIPDDYEIADFSQLISMPFMPKLPTYTARQLRENPTRPFKLFFPLICLFEKIVNGIIDFIWSALGLEAIIPPPHIKLCSKSKDPGQADADALAKELGKEIFDPKDLKGLNGEDLNDANDIPRDSGFVYNITRDDGTVIKGLNYDEMQKYIKENEDIGYNFQF